MGSSEESLVYRVDPIIFAPTGDVYSFFQVRLGLNLREVRHNGTPLYGLAHSCEGPSLNGPNDVSEKNMSKEQCISNACQCISNMVFQGVQRGSRIQRNPGSWEGSGTS